MGDAETPYFRFAKALRDYFGPSGHETEIFLVFAFVLLFISLLLLFQHFSPPARKTSQKKDFEFFEQVLQERGLENFDGEILLELAEQYNVHPVYKILLDRQVFDKIVQKVELRKTDPEDGTKRRSFSVEYLGRISRRLFTNT